MEIIKNREKTPETRGLIERRKEITKPGNLRFKLESSLNRKVWVPRRPDKRGKDEVAAVDLELLFRNIENNRWGGGYFEFNEPKPILVKKSQVHRNKTRLKPNQSAAPKKVRWQNFC